MVGRSPLRFLRVNLGVVLVYSLLAVVLTFPLVFRLSTHAAGDSIDAPPLAWNLWWVKFAAVNLGVNLLDCSFLFYPIGINLAFYTLTVLNGLLSVPLQDVFGLIATSNLLLWSSFVLSGWGAFLLIEHLLSNSLPAQMNGKTGDQTKRVFGTMHLAALVGGFVYAFSSSKLFFAALGQANIASSQWIPFYILCLFKMRQKPQSFKFPVLVALFLLFQTWAEMTYASFLILFTVLFLCYFLLSAPNTKALYGFARGGVLVVIIFVIGISPLLTTMLPDLFVEGDIFVEGTGFSETFSSDVLGLVVPTQLHPLLGDIVEHLGFPHDKGQHLFLGFVTLAIAGCGLACWLKCGVVRFWGLATVVFLLLSCGPMLRFNGSSLGVPLPFQILQRIPFFNGNRYPGRISVLVVLALAVLVGFGMYSFLQHVAAGHKQYVSFAVVIIVGLIGFEHLAVPLPTVDLRVSTVYAQIAEDPRDVTVLDIPLAWRNGFRVTGTMDPLIMLEQFAQTVHGKRILAGNTSRNPEYKFQYFTELPVINSIIALETGHALSPEQLDADKLVAESVLRFFNIQYIVVHPQQAGDEIRRYVESVIPVRKMYEDGDVVAYRVNLPEYAPETYLDLGTPDAAISLGEGWGEAYVTDGYVWAQRDGALLMVPIASGPKKMSFRVWVPGARQVMRVDLNGHILPPIELAEGWGEYEVALPADSVVTGLNRLRLRFSRLFPVAGVLAEGPPLGQSNISVPVNIVAKSAGEEVGDFGHIYLNGWNVSLEGTGYNMVALDPKTGTILDRRTFNTFESAAASRAMAAWVDSLSAGTLVVVAVRDEASLHLTEDAIAALRSLGLEGDLRGHFRWGHAAIGSKGLAPGTGLEQTASLRPATVKLGLGVTRPRVAAAFDWIRFAPVEANASTDTAGG